MEQLSIGPLDEWDIHVSFSRDATDVMRISIVDYLGDILREKS